jgi:NitT/TauT family transport system substrate-binding protein
MAAHTGTPRLAAAAAPLLPALVVAHVVLLLLAGGAGASGNAPTAGGRRAATLTVATLPLEPAALAFYAKDEGLFAREGLDVRIATLSDPQQLVAALVSGDAQFSGLNVGGTAILKSRNAPVRLVAAGALYRPTAATTGLVAAPGKTIVRARDLVGKTIAIDATNTIAHIGLLKWLKRNGVSADDVKLAEVPFAQMIGPLREGTVDAAVLPEPFLTLALRGGATRIADPFRAVCSSDCLLTFWLARKDADPAVAARFRNAIQAAAAWANKRKHDAASGVILARYTGLDRSLIAKITRTRFAERLRPASAQPWIDAFVEFGVIPSSFRAIDLVK